MEILEILLVIAFLIVLLRNTIYLLFLWQLKEYRWDRFWVHLKTWQGKRLLFGKTATIKWLILLLTLFLLWKKSHLEFLPGPDGILHFVQNDINWIVFVLFFIEAVYYIKQLLTSGWQWPIFTFKTILIGSFTFFLLGLGIFGLSSLSLPAKLLLFDRALLPLISLMIIFADIPTKIYDQFLIAKAKRKIKNHPQLLTIGITGSYGKSTTKEFLAQILSQKFKVLKTPANINTDIGVAKTILKDLKSKHQIFVSEMGAYKRGEIKAICEIVKPKMGIITGINEQHLALFGDLKKTMAAKFELIKALPHKGLAVFNGKNNYCLTMADQADEIGKTTVIVKEKKKKTPSNLAVEFFDLNVRLATVVAQKLGVDSAMINQVVKKLKPPAHTMQIFKKNDLSLIDDTYNSNPQGVLAALDYLKNYQGKRIFVFQPMIELGKAAARLHQKVGRKAAKICDSMILTNKNYYQDFVKDAREKVSLRRNLPKIKKGVILFEGREAKKLFELLISNY